MLNYPTSPCRSPLASPLCASDLVAGQRDEFRKNSESVRGLNLDGAGATPHFPARCVTWTAGSLQPSSRSCATSLGRAPGRRERKSRSHKVSVKTAIISVTLHLHPSSPTLVVNGFDTAKSKISGTQKQEWEAATPSCRRIATIPQGFGLTPASCSCLTARGRESGAP